MGAGGGPRWRGEVGGDCLFPGAGEGRRPGGWGGGKAGAPAWPAPPGRFAVRSFAALRSPFEIAQPVAAPFDVEHVAVV